MLQNLVSTMEKSQNSFSVLNKVGGWSIAFFPHFLYSLFHVFYPGAINIHIFVHRESVLH